MSKILIIGQAPPFVKQQFPYDTTMLYSWLNELGIDKEGAQLIFDFDAVYDQFPGFSGNGGHLKPSLIQMNDYWDRSLRFKVLKCSAIICLGACAKDFIIQKSVDKPIAYLLHPSKRNYSIYQKNKQFIIKEFLRIIDIHKPSN